MKKVMKAMFLVCMMLACNLVFADATTPTIYNVTLTSADTEYSQALTGVKKFTVQCRTGNDIRCAYTTGLVASSVAPYFTIKSGGAYWEDGMDRDSTLTLYFAGDSGGEIMEIIVWN